MTPTVFIEESSRAEISSVGEVKVCDKEMIHSNLTVFGRAEHMSNMVMKFLKMLRETK